MQSMSTRPGESACGFVVAGCHSTGALQLVEATLDHVVHGVDGHIGNLTHGYRRDNIADFDIFPHFIKTIAPVCDQKGRLRQVVGHYQVTAHMVRALTRRDPGAYEGPDTVDAEMDLGRKAFP